MSDVTDEFMTEMLKTTRRYTMVLLHRTARRGDPGADAVVWEHGRRNFALRRDGLICLVCPVVKDETDVAGLYIFSADLARTRKVMDDDPAVEAGIFTYEAHVIDGFPGDALSR